MKIILCTQCHTFGEDRPATCTAQYLASSLVDTKFKAREFLCDSCASNTRIYTSILPLDAAGKEVLPEAPIETPAEVEAPSRFPDWYQRLVDKNEVCDNIAHFEAEAYKGYVSYGIGGSDGYYAPEDIEAFLHTFRKDPEGALYSGNDLRTVLAPKVNSYTDIIEAIYG